MGNDSTSSISSTVAIITVVTILPVVWGFIQNQAESHPGRADEIFKSAHVFREPLWLGFLFGLWSLGLPFAALCYTFQFQDWHFYGTMGLLFGLLGAGGLVEYARTSVRVANDQVSYQGLFRRFCFALSEVKSAWVSGQFIIVDVGKPQHFVLPSLLHRAGLLVSVLNRGPADTAQPSESTIAD
jgi:hypothetical protein